MPISFNWILYTISYALRAKFPAHLFLLDLITFIILGDEQNLWSFLPSPKSYGVFRNVFASYGQDILAHRSTPKLEDHPLLPVNDCFFNIFVAILHIWRLSAPYATTGHATLYRGYKP
jgi:hypothetical protein